MFILSKKGKTGTVFTAVLLFVLYMQRETSRNTNVVKRLKEQIRDVIDHHSAIYTNVSSHHRTIYTNVSSHHRTIYTNVSSYPFTLDKYSNLESKDVNSTMNTSNEQSGIKTTVLRKNGHFTATELVTHQAKETGVIQDQTNEYPPQYLSKNKVPKPDETDSYNNTVTEREVHLSNLSNTSGTRHSELQGSLKCKPALAPKGTFPLVALVSYPGSGNTWTRHLLEQSSGFYTGSIYNDKALYKAGFKGEYEPVKSGTVILVKTHKPHIIPQFEAAVLLIRNPFDAFIAEFNRRHNGHTGYAASHVFKQPGWNAFIPVASKKWFSLIVKVITTSKKHLVVYYEDLKVDVVSNVKRMMTFLNQPINEHRMRCMLEDKEGQFKRKHTDTVDPYNSKMKKIVNAMIKQGRQFLLKYGGKPMPDYERVV